MTRTYNRSGARKKDVIATLRNKYATPIAQIAKQMKVSVRTARRYVAELIQTGVVVVRFKEARKPYKKPISFYGLKDNK